MPFIIQPQSLTDHIDLIDVQGWDFHHTTTSLLMRGKKTAIIETGHHRCGAQILAALQTRAIAFETVGFICVTHRHGDHCGGATPLAAALPDAKVVGHKYAIATLHNPSRLNQGAQELFGKYAQPIQPLPDRAVTWEVDKGDQIDLGDGLTVEIIGTPGHTSDHLAYFETSSRILYTGDAMGLLGPKNFTVTPTSFPPSFKFDAYKASIEKLQGYDPTFLVFSHFGAVTGSDIPIIFNRALTTLDSWKDTVESAWHTESSQASVMKAIRDRFLKELEVFPPETRPLFIEVMAKGLSKSLIPNSDELIS
jgi:glyoxylase-like metal-dependent hydrolase (beta-lactamase superfamily II)